MTHITPDIIQDHGLTVKEYACVEDHMGRAPNLLELGIFSVMWSEHCSYKSSRRYLSTLPTSAPHVICGPGENAGVIDIGDGQAVIFKMESHNHPSYIEPYQGAATGVGGIMRDVFTMGARPIANMNALRFGEMAHAKTRHLVSGVVSGIGGYGNCMGVPTIGGETNFDKSYNGNILVNAMCVGLAKKDRIFYAAARGAGNPVVYVGAKTGRDGIHGATMASTEFDDESERKRPTVQVGDPFVQKRLLEACLELMEQDAIIAIQDMGAAGLTSSSVEMAAKGGGGFDMDLDKVPQREQSMSAYEMMLSESQERMLMVLQPGKEDAARAIFDKWGLDFSVIGITTDNGRLVIRHEGKIKADMPVAPLADAAPNYDRPYTLAVCQEKQNDPSIEIYELQLTILAKDKTQNEIDTIAKTLLLEKIPEETTRLFTVGYSSCNGRAEIYLIQEKNNIITDALIDAAQNLVKTSILDDVQIDSREETCDLAQQAGGDTLVTALGKLLASPDLCSREWIWSQYDHTVMGDTVVAPGGNAGIVRIHGSTKALAISTDVTPRYCLADPVMGGKQAVAETFRNICASGGRPLAITNCLNFGNPERPEIMGQFVGCIEGMKEACEKLAYPVVSGNVSLYNETNGNAIPPTPAIGGVGIIDDVQHIARLDTAQSGDVLIALGLTHGWLGQSLYLRELFGHITGAPPPVDLDMERCIGEFVRSSIKKAIPSATHDVSDGGLLVAAAEMALGAGLGLTLMTPVRNRRAAFWYGEDQGRYLIAVRAADTDSFVLKASMAGIQATKLGYFGGEYFTVDTDDSISLSDLSALHAKSLPDYMADDKSKETTTMAMSSDEITTLIRAALPDAEIEITDLAGDGDHYKARIVSAAFAGKTRVAQHQLVYKSLKGKMGAQLHALALETAAK